MARQNISIENMADVLRIHRNSVANKLYKGSFSIEEAFRIKNSFFREFDLNYLFTRENSKTI